MHARRLLIWALVAVSVPVWAEPLAEHVVLVSVDGFRPEFYRDSTWPAPTIQQLARDGASADGVRGVFPTVTYPSHTTMVTGVMPAEHGVLFNRPFEPGGQTGRWYWEYDAIRVPTLWTVAREAGMKTASVSWPVSAGAPIDWTVPEIWALEGEDRLKPMRDWARPTGLWEELEKYATGALTMETYSASYIARDDETGQIAAYLMKQYTPALLALHLIATDHFQHEDGREADSTRRAVACADNAIRMLVEAADQAGVLDKTAFVIVGDHGFVDLHTEIAPNVWLRDAGLIEDRKDRGTWRAAFHCEAGGAFLKLNDPNDSDAAVMALEVVQNAPAHIAKQFRIVSSDELAAIGADPDAIFGLSAGLGATFSERTNGDALGPTSGGTHGYYPTDFPEVLTGLVVSGAGVEAGRTIHRAGLEDVAPLVAALLGLEMPEAILGAAPTGVLTRP